MSRPQDPWVAYLFESHSEATLRAWAWRLHRFRFVRAAGGHANDCDSLTAAFSYLDLVELLALLERMSIPWVRYAQKPPQAEPGVPYPADVYAAFPSLIPGTEWIRQPGHARVAGQEAFVWCAGGRVTISVGSECGVDEAHVAAAEKIEKELSGLRAIDPPVDNRRCICPKFYPDYFA